MKSTLSKILFSGLKKTSVSFSTHGVKKYFKNAKWLTIAKVGTMLLSFVTMSITARVFGPEKFGIFSYVVSFVGFFGIIAGLGIDNLVFKNITENKQKRLEILGSGIFLRSITGLCAIILVSLTAFLIKEPPEIKILILASSLLFITQPLLLLSYDFLKDAESKSVAIAQIITLSISSILKIIAVYFFDSILAILLITAFENVMIGLLLATVVVLIKKRDLFFTYSYKYMRLFLLSSLPLTFYTASEVIYSKIDQIMLKQYLPIEQIGYYSVAVRLTELWYFIPNIIIGAVFPAFIYTQKDKTEYNRRLSIVLLTFTILSFLISLCTFIFGKYFVSIVFGIDFIPSTKILSVYIFSLFGSYISFIAYQDLFIRSKINLIVVISSITALLNISLNYFWIPIYGGIGAAYATLISYSCIPLFYLIIKKTKYYHA